MNLSHRSSSGIALVITLLVIVVLTVAVTAFMQSMSLERRTSAAYLNITRADEAVQAGLQRVTNIFAANTSNDYFSIVKLESAATSGTLIPYYYIGTGTDTTSGAAKIPGPTTYTPLFSYLATPPATQATPPPASADNKPVLPTMTDPANSKPLLAGDMPLVNTSWETISTGDPNYPKIRYCFWVEDLSGRIDASVAGNKLEVVGVPDTLQNNQNDDKHLRNGTFTPNQLGFFTIFDKISKTDQGSTPAGTLYDYRSLFVSAASIKQALGTSYTTYKTEVDQSITANLEGDLETQVVPYGLGLMKAGDLKVDVNSVVADTTSTDDQRVKKIADAIRQNMPKFDKRKGASYGLITDPTRSNVSRFQDDGATPATGKQNYINTLAASIIDYADTDNKATVGADYRGIDSYPFISEWAHKYLFTGVTKKGSNWYVNIEMSPFLELWNLTDKPITGKFKFHDVNTDFFKNGTEDAVFTDYDSIVTGDKDKEYQVTDLRPNQYIVVQLDTLAYSFDAGTNKPTYGTSAAIPINNSNELKSGRYEFIWESKIVDEPFGLEESDARSLPQNSARWAAALPGFRHGADSDLFTEIGDPRSTFYINKTVAVNTMNDNSATKTRQTWWGRNDWNVGSETTEERIMRPSKWLDADHGNSLKGIPVGINSDPVSGVPVASRPPTIEREAVSTISNTGKYSSITEIGNIYDPAQWNEGGTTATTIPNQSPATDIVTTASNTSAAQAGAWGGGFTLRIGRQEFSRFTQSDVEPAWKLLDVLCAGQQRQIQGLININTASKDALRTLLAGLIFNGDPGIRTGALPTGDATQIPKTYPYSSVYPVVSPASQADTVAQAIIDGRPYISSSQLSNLKISGTALNVFGDKLRWSTTDPDRPIEWDDAGAEEMFKSVYELSTVRSRNFRVFVTGQVLNRLGKPAATSSKEFQIALIPTRDSITKKVTKLNLEIKNEVSPQ